jgi:succinate dehydrogenase hydrophobic anchor subunit
MGAHFGRFSQLGSFVGLITVLMWSSAALAQRSGNAAAAALAGTFMLFFLGILLIGYVYMALALQTIADKTSTQNEWLAWIPIANIFLMLDIAKKPMWWFILFLIPLVNIVIGIMVWMGIAVARHKPDWWGILMIVPIANLVVPGYLAWAD